MTENHVFGFGDEHTIQFAEDEIHMFSLAEQGPAGIEGDAGAPGTTADEMLKTTAVINASLQQLQSNAGELSAFWASTKAASVVGIDIAVTPWTVDAPSGHGVNLAEYKVDDVTKASIGATGLGTFDQVMVGGTAGSRFKLSGAYIEARTNDDSGYASIKGNIGYFSWGTYNSRVVDIANSYRIWTNSFHISDTFEIAFSSTSSYIGAKDLILSRYNDGVDTWLQIPTGKGLVADTVMVGGTGGVRLKLQSSIINVRTNNDLAYSGLRASYLLADNFRSTGNDVTAVVQSRLFAGAVGNTALEMATGIQQHSSGEGIGVHMMPTMDTTGTASGIACVTDLLGSLAGSGAHLIHDFRTAGVSKASIGADGRTQFSALLNAATGNEYAMRLDYEADKLTSGLAYGLYIDVTKTNVPDGTYPLMVNINGAPKVWADLNGELFLQSGLRIDQTKMRIDGGDIVTANSGGYYWSSTSAYNGSLDLALTRFDSSTAIYLDLSTGGGIMTPGGTSADPSYAFQDGGSGAIGLFRRSSNSIGLVMQNGERFYFSTTQFQSSTSGSFGLLRRAASATVPTLSPDNVDFNTGIGGAAGYVSIIATSTEVIRAMRDGSNNPVAKIMSVLGIVERSSDPAEPVEGECVVWLSDGVGKGDDGDVLIASQAGGSTTWSTLHDHSAGAAW